MCGGTKYLSVLAKRFGGLSPRVRGNHNVSRGDHRHTRSIPACAGEPAAQDSQTTPPTVYPRVCGGTTAVRINGVDYGGLSPRVRGNPRCASWKAGASGSIPACAGEPSRSSSCCADCTVYPRVCGGTQGQVRFYRTLAGLSPRVRGNHSVAGCRSTPIWVYPRVCGGTPSESRSCRTV